MFFLNKRSNFEEKKAHELSYRPNTIIQFTLRVILLSTAVFMSL